MFFFLPHPLLLKTKLNPAQQDLDVVSLDEPLLSLYILLVLTPSLHILDSAQILKRTRAHNGVPAKPRRDREPKGQVGSGG